MKDLYNIPITIAEILLDLHSPLSSAELGIEEKYSSFFGYPVKACYHIHLTWEAFKYETAFRGQSIYDPGELWKMYQIGSYFYASFPYGRDKNFIIGKQDFLRANSTWNNILLSERITGPNWKSLLNIGAGELLFRTAIVLCGGLVFHSAAIDINGKGIAIIGHSGEGKSTLVHLLNEIPNSVLINEDRIAIRSVKNDSMLYGVPWGGSSPIAINHKVPLSAIILLQKSDANSIEMVAPSSAASLLLPRSFLPYWDLSLMVNAMHNMSIILKRTPVYCFHFKPDSSVIPFIQSLL